MLETVPGMIISQHSGEGKANQYYLRGFNLDHGTDFSTTVAGVPGEHADRRTRARLFRHQLPDSRAGQRRAVQERAVLRGRRRFLGGRRREHQLRQSARSASVRVSGGSDGWGRAVCRGVAACGRRLPARGCRVESQRRSMGAARTTTRRSTACSGSAAGTTATASPLPAWVIGPTGTRTDQVAERAIDERPDIPVRVPRSHRWRTKPNRQSMAAEFQRSAGPSSLRGAGVSPAQQPQSVLELHLLPRRSGDTAISSNRPSGGRRQAGASRTDGWATSSSTAHRERGRRAASPRLA